jgi:hypothetical protein
MEIFEERAREAGIDLAQYGGRIPAELMLHLGIPLIVACTKCGMTMSGFEALVDEELRVYCTDCADIMDPDDSDEIEPEDGGEHGSVR